MTPRTLLLLTSAALALACTQASTTTPVASPLMGPGVTFTYPANGQLDVPVGARLVLHFSGPVSASAATAPCAATGAGLVSGSFCVVGPEGVVSTTPKIAGTQGDVLLETPSALQPGTVYRVYATPALLGGTADNLPGAQPLFTFTTRQQTPIEGIAPMIISVNDNSPNAFIPGTGISPKLPFLEVTTLRLVFSEPVDESTVTLGSTFTVTGPTGPVPGALTVQGIHLTFDPDAPLTAGATYAVALNGISDLNGEALTPVTLTLQPQSAIAGGTLYTQYFAVSPPAPPNGDSTTWPMSPLAGAYANSAEATGPLIGDQVLGLLSGSIVGLLADPSAFGGPIPFILPKGQVLDMTGMPVLLMGQIPAGFSSGNVHIQILADATGYMYRNPYRSPAATPDDTLSPVTVDITFDAAMYTDDPLGNGIISQTVMGVHLLGTSVTSNGRLAIEQVGAMELNALGVALAPTNMVMSLTSGGSAPGHPPPAQFALMYTYPRYGDAMQPVDGEILLNFSRTVNFEKLQANPDFNLLSLNGTQVPFSVRQDGTDLILKPTSNLSYATAYTVQLGSDQNPIVDWDGQALLDPGMFVFSTPNLSDAGPTAPLLLALFPGAPCALTDATDSSPGRCVGGTSPGDGGDDYLPFTLPADRAVQAQFDMPMDPSTMVLGQSCGHGTVRVEEMTSDGACQGAVQGRMTVGERSFSFVPNQPWTPGQSYRLIVVGGSSAACSGGEICSLARKGWPSVALNTHPLDGVAVAGGGPDIVIPFTGTPAISQGNMPLFTDPNADVNGNGFLDPGETFQAVNRFAVEVTGTGAGTLGAGVGSAKMLGINCIPGTAPGAVCDNLNTVLPIELGAAIPACPVDTNGYPTTAGPPCVPVRIFPEIIQNTSLTLNAQVNLIVASPTVTSSTGMLLLRVREPGVPTTGYIMLGPDGSPEFVIDEDTYFDAPDLQISVAGIPASHNLHSYPLSMTLAGPLTFTPDGRMQVSLSNTTDVVIRVELHAVVDLLVGSVSVNAGYIELTIPAGTLNLTLKGNPRQ
jgi:hypothetical protein